MARFAGLLGNSKRPIVNAPGAEQSTWPVGLASQGAHTDRRSRLASSPGKRFDNQGLPVSSRFDSRD